MNHETKNSKPEICSEDLSGGCSNVDEITRLLTEHLEDMKAISPPESKHALDLDGLRQDDITFWSVKHQGIVVACCALKALSASHGEIKSMRTAAASRGLGLGSLMLEHIIAEAKSRGYRRLSLETGSMDFFKPAQALYLKHGFEFCAPFASYKEDPNSVFMTLSIVNDSKELP